MDSCPKNVNEKNFIAEQTSFRQNVLRTKRSKTKKCIAEHYIVKKLLEKDGSEDNTS